MIKYLINLILILFLFSCNELDLNNVSDVVENSTNKIEEIIDNTKEDKKEHNLTNLTSLVVSYSAFSCFLYNLILFYLVMPFY